MPVSTMGKIKGNSVYLLCSDGLTRELEKRELAHGLPPRKCSRKEELRESLVRLTELVKQRGEADNITAVGVYVGKGYAQQDTEAPFLLTEKWILCEADGDA